MKELIEIQNKLKAPKGQYNSFGKYKYRSCEDILEALKPLLYEHKCQLTIADDMVAVGARIYVKAVATLTNSTGEAVTTTAFAREEEVKKGMDASQVTGAASSYARKYALNGMFCIDDTKDSDTTNIGQQPSADPDMLALAMQEINGAQSISTLTGIFNNYKALHADPRFMQALTNKKNLLKDGTN